MQEAKYSISTKLVLDGFETQATVRSETSWKECLDEASQLVWALKNRGAVPGKNGFTRNGTPENGKAPAVPPTGLEPRQVVCPACSLADRLELIHFKRGDTPLSKYKCQRCKKWLP